MNYKTKYTMEKKYDHICKRDKKIFNLGVPEHKSHNKLHMISAIPA